ncbi:MAG: anion transporter [Betaproteobacteria bacterium]|nr:anion transporter [Betaproteobacteria bacterium]
MTDALRLLLAHFLKDRLLHLLLLFAGLLALFHPVAPARAWQSIHGPTLLTLAGLLLLTKGIEVSGAFDHLGRHILNRLTHERPLALFLTAAAAALSTVLTNDIALFVMVPLTLSLRNLAGLPIARLVIFEALAVNAGSMLTPIGNPQNILLWQLSHRSFLAFTAMMAPLALPLTALLLVLAAAFFPDRPIRITLPETPADWNRPLFWGSALLYVLFVAAAEWGHAGLGLLLVLAAAAWIRPRLLAETDWSLIAVFALMFVDIRLLTDANLLRPLLEILPAAGERERFLAAVGASQVISNVPATILLTPWLPAGPLLAYAVNVGGFGTAVGSLANLIALRMANDRGIWLQFHYFSLPFLVISLLFGGWLSLSAH